MSPYIELRFSCRFRHRSFLDRFRIGADGHRPDPETMHYRQVEWREFKGTRMPVPAARCIDCHTPIVNAVANLWSVRMYDSADAEEAFAASVNGHYNLAGMPPAGGGDMEPS